MSDVINIGDHRSDARKPRKRRKMREPSDLHSLICSCEARLRVLKEAAGGMNAMVSHGSDDGILGVEDLRGLVFVLECNIEILHDTWKAMFAESVRRRRAPNGE